MQFSQSDVNAMFVDIIEAVRSNVANGAERSCLYDDLINTLEHHDVTIDPDALQGLDRLFDKSYANSHGA